MLLRRSILPLALVALTASASAADPRGDNPDAPASPPEEQLKKFHVPPGFEVQLVAAEPQIQKPLNLTFDTAGRLWVTGSELYPWPANVDALGQPIPDFEKAYADMATAFRVGDKAPPAPKVARDSVRVLSNFRPDGRAQKIEIFADGLNVPSGIQPLPRKPGAKGDTAIVYSIPNIWRMEDTDGDGKADKREVLYGMFGYLDTHGGSSSYLHWIDGWIYGTHGFRNHSEVRDRRGRTTVLESGNTYRFRPDGSAFEIYTNGQTNPFGLTVDPRGNFYSADSHSKPVYMLLRGGYYEGIGKQHDGLGFAPRITDDDHGSSAIAGIAYYADDKFPVEFRGNLFNGNPVTQKINRDKLEWHGSSPKAIRQPDFLSCDDPWFRPVQVKLGPDGALYIADFYNPIIGHYEVPLTDPRRDTKHGRIWRVVWRGDDANPPTSLPDLTKLEPEPLTKKLLDPSLEVQRLAFNEIMARAYPVSSATAAFDGPLTALKQTGSQAAMRYIVALMIQPLLDPGAASSQVLQGRALDQYAGIAQQPPDIAADSIRYLADVEMDGPFAFNLTNAVAGAATDPNLQRALAGFIQRKPTEVGFQWLVRRMKSPDRDPEDVELAYACRMAIRDSLKTTDGYRWAAYLIDAERGADEVIADASLAVKTPAAAEFLLKYLETTKLESPRAADYLKHVLLNLPEERIFKVGNVIDAAGQAPAAKKLALAASLEEAIRQRRMNLPGELTIWSQRTILSALGHEKDELAKVAITTARDAKWEAKLKPLTAVILDPARDGTLRLAALEAAANLPASREVMESAFADPKHMILRKRAAELLAQNGSTKAILAALPNVPEELAVSIGGALARTDGGAVALLETVEAGKISPRLLLNKAIAGPLIARPKSVRDRAQYLVKDLLPEDARLNALIAERAAAFAQAKPDIGHGAQIFQQTCAACHRFRNAGGNIGPNLDGVIARGPARLVEDILDPNRNVDPLFRLTTIETTDGQTLAGGNLRDQGAAILLADPTGKDITVEKARIKKQTISPLSLMPPAFEQAISPADFNDLLGFLLNPSLAP